MSERNLVPAGQYTAVAVPVQLEDGSTAYAQFGESKEKKTKQVLLNFEILGGDYAGVRLPWFGYFTQGTVDRTLQSLRYAGFKGDDLAALLDQELTQEVSVTVEHHTYNDKTYARVAWVNAPGGGGMKLASTMDKNALRTFSASMKRYTTKVPEVAGKKAERETAGNGAASAAREPGADDDRLSADDLGF